MKMNLNTPTATPGIVKKKWLPRSLELLLGGRKVPTEEERLTWTRRQHTHTEEARQMELLIDEAEGEFIPDDGELEGSGDNFDG